MKTLEQLYDDLLEIDYEQEVLGNVPNFQIRRDQIVEGILLRESMEEEPQFEDLW